jgi:hypothetical protein
MVYRATNTDPLDPWNPQHDLGALEAFTQAFAAGQDAETFGRVKDATLMRRKEVKKDILVVVRRGAGVGYAEKEGSPRIPAGDMADIREDWPGQTWDDIEAVQDARCENCEYKSDGNVVSPDDRDRQHIELWNISHPLDPI